jgi:hypothetical protein
MYKLPDKTSWQVCPAKSFFVHSSALVSPLYRGHSEEVDGVRIENSYKELGKVLSRPIGKPFSSSKGMSTMGTSVTFAPHGCTYQEKENGPF